MRLLAGFVHEYASLVNYALLTVGVRLADIPSRLSWWDLSTVVEGDQMLASAWASWLTSLITQAPTPARGGVNTPSDVPGEDFTNGTYVKRGGSTPATWEEIEAFCA